MFVQRNMQRLSTLSKTNLGMQQTARAAQASNPFSGMTQSANSQRPYFSVLERVKERFRLPMRHIESFAEVNGQNY